MSASLQVLGRRLPAILFVALGASSPVWSQEPTLGPVKQAYDDFVSQYNGNLRDVEELLAAERRTNGPCAEVLSRIRSRERDLKPAFDALAGHVAQLIKQVQPILDLAQEADKQRTEIAKLNKDRQAIRDELTKRQAASAGAQENDRRNEARAARGDW